MLTVGDKLTRLGTLQDTVRLHPLCRPPPPGAAWRPNPAVTRPSCCPCRSALSPHRLVDTFEAPHDDIHTLYDNLESSVAEYGEVRWCGGAVAGVPVPQLLLHAAAHTRQLGTACHLWCTAWLHPCLLPCPLSPPTEPLPGTPHNGCQGAAGALRVAHICRWSEAQMWAEGRAPGARDAADGVR